MSKNPFLCSDVHNNRLKRYLALLVGLVAAKVSEAGETQPPFSEELCHDPSTGHQKYMLGVDETSLIPIDLPKVLDFPTTSFLLVHFESILLFCASIGLAFLLSRIAPITSIRSLNEEQTKSVKILLALTVLISIPVSFDRFFFEHNIHRFIQEAEIQLHVNNYALADQSLEEAKIQIENDWAKWLAILRPFGVHRIDFSHMKTVNGIAAVDAGIQNESIDSINSALDYFDSLDSLALEATISALSHQASLASKTDTDGAFQPSRKAVLLSSRQDTKSNFCNAAYRHTVHLAREGKFADSLSTFSEIDSPRCSFKSQDLVALRGAIAHYEIESYLAEKTSTSEMTAAVKVAEDAFLYGVQNEKELPFLSCQFTSILDAHAILSLSNGNPERAVSALERTDELFPNRLFVKEVLPKALYSWGKLLITEEEFELARDVMNRGYNMTEGRDPLLVDGLAHVFSAWGSQKISNGLRDEGIETLSKAYELTPQDPSVSSLLANSLLARGDDLLKISSTSEALSDFNNAAEVSAKHRATAVMRIEIVQRSGQRLEDLVQHPKWLGIPVFYAEVPRDVDLDGYPETILLYDDESPVAIATAELDRNLQNFKRVMLLDEAQQTVVMWRDQNNDGELDERNAYSGSLVEQILADADGDRSPDVRLQFSEGSEYRRDYLSGRVAMVMREGIVSGKLIDWFSKPDAYIRMYKNGRLVFTSNPVKNSSFPIWNEGVVVQYKYRDHIKLELWDRDRGDDDKIDTYDLWRMPTSDVYRFENGLGAIRLTVKPTGLSPGHRFHYSTPSVSKNYFLDHPDAADEYGDLIAQAHMEAARAEVMSFMGRRVVDRAIDATSPNPAQRKILKFAAKIILDNTM